MQVWAIPATQVKSRNRFIGTIEAIQRDLTEDGLVLRYRSHGSGDGLPEGEGVFPRLRKVIRIGSRP